MTVKEMREILEGCDDNDFIVVEIDETSLGNKIGLNEDLYAFSVDFIDGIETNTGIQTEIRLTILPDGE
jgi:hypothetical protein